MATRVVVRACQCPVFNTPSVVSPKPEILLSVLIPALSSRKERSAALLENLARQSDPRLEVIVFMDNYDYPLGVKRNSMMDRAAGKYLMHCDDDEQLSPHFFKSLLPEMQHDVDAIGYNTSVIFNGCRPFTVRTIWGAAVEQPRHEAGGYSDIVRPFWHWNLWRTSLVRQFRFPDHSENEDWQWLKQIYPHVKTHRKLEESLFTHIWNAGGSAFEEIKKARSN